MKTVADLVRGWLLKAESDLTSAELCLDAGKALDTVCFHAQQRVCHRSVTIGNEI